MGKKLGGSNPRVPDTYEDYQVSPIIVDDYTVGLTESLILVDSLAKVINIQLPDPVLRRKFKIVNTSYNNSSGMGYGYNLIPFGSEKVGGNNTGPLAVYGGFIVVDVIADGVNYHVGGQSVATL